MKKYQTSIVLAVSFIVTMSAFWLIPEIAFVVFIALLLDLLLRPLVNRMERLRLLPRSVAAGLSLIIFCILVIVLFTVLSTTLANSIQSFVADLPRLNASIRQLLESYEFISNELDELWTELATLSINVLRSSLKTVVTIFTRVFDVVIILFTAFYLLKDGREMQRWIARLFPARDHLRVFRLFDHILFALHTYIRSQIIICFIMGTIVFIYFSMRGLPYASIFAVISGLSEFIPVIGPTIASAFGTALTATISPELAIQTLIFYVTITQINHNFIYPQLIGKSLGLHPIVILLGILLGGSVLDVAGMFLAVPLIVIIRLVIVDIHRNATKKRTLPRATPRRKKKTNDNEASVD
ncbi:MAG: AI-2E family transporter [Selenomonadaceae bacterium]